MEPETKAPKPDHERGGRRVADPGSQFVACCLHKFPVTRTCMCAAAGEQNTKLGSGQCSQQLPQDATALKCVALVSSLPPVSTSLARYSPGTKNTGNL